MQARLQVVDQGTVKEACGLAGHPDWFFSDRLHPRVIGLIQVNEKLFGQQWSRSTIDIAATRYKHCATASRCLLEAR